MTDKKISELDAGGAVQDTDQLAVERAGSNYKVNVGSMAAEDREDFYNEEEVDNLLASDPAYVQIDRPLILTEAYNGKEIHTVNTSGDSPSYITITVPYHLPVGFRCAIIRAGTGELRVETENGSPEDTLNGVLSGSANYDAQYVGGYLRKPSLGKLLLIGAGITVT